MNIKEIVALLKDRVNDPHTQIYDLQAIAIAALTAVEEAEENLQQAIDEVLEEEELTISLDIALAVKRSVRSVQNDKNLEELADSLK